MTRPKESSIHKQIATYLKVQYPKLIFRTDFAAGIKMSIGQAVKHKSLQSGSKYPDLFIAKPSKDYHGLFIELKRDRSEVYRKDGLMKSDKHILEQSEMLDDLRAEGYMAVFGCGFDEARKVIDNYLKQ